MSTVSPTPGPWSDNNENPRKIISADGGLVASVFGGKIEDLEPLANAKLISAAPTMLAYVRNQAAAGDAVAKALISVIEDHSAK